VIKQFYKWLKGDCEHFPPEVSWIRRRTNGSDRKPTGDILSPAEAERLVDCCDNMRDKAFIAFLYESGARIGEVLSMRINDFMESDSHSKVRLNGKTGERVIMIVTSAPLIAQYLSTHPFRRDGSSFLWLSIGTYNHNKPLSYIGAKKIINKVFRKTGIIKRCNPHMFRHSRATELASYLTEVQMCLYFGWDGKINATKLAEYVVGGENPNASPFRRKVNKVVRVWDHGPMKIQEAVEASHKAEKDAEEHNPAINKIRECKHEVKGFEDKVKSLLDIMGAMDSEFLNQLPSNLKAALADNLSSLLDDMNKLEAAMKGVIKTLTGGKWHAKAEAQTVETEM